ncbi:MAG: REP-associated tyrosine transposase [Candidatus Geothermincolia bacterium]
MSRPIRIQFENAFYHLTARGNAKQDIFTDDTDRALFLEMLGQTVRDEKWICHAYCLMGNHYHLLVETPKANLSEGMRQINGLYAQAFNRKNQRIGHLFQGRFDARLIQKDAYLLAVARYVVQNPIRAGLVEEPESWPWSSYLPTAASSNWVTFLTPEFILAQFSDNTEIARLQYMSFVADTTAPSPWEELRGGILLGTDSWVGQIEGLFKNNWQDNEIPWHQRLAARASLEQVFSDGKRSRDELVYEAYHVHGYKLREIGEYLQLTPTRVGQILKRERAALQ